MGNWVMIIVVAVFILDQATKYLAQVYLQLGETYPVLDGIFHLTLVRNPGAAFGLLAHQTGIFILLTGLLLGAVFWWWRRIAAQSFLFRLGLALTLGGALGNLLDRLRYSRVTDFLDFRIWPVFNLADIAIVCGVILVAWDLWPRGAEHSQSGKG